MIFKTQRAPFCSTWILMTKAHAEAVTFLHLQVPSVLNEL
jgi:hypothetical protein